MDRDRWNKLYDRVFRLMWNPDVAYCLRVKAAWIAWAERVTGTTCFFMRWQ